MVSWGASSNGRRSHWLQFSLFPGSRRRRWNEEEQGGKEGPQTPNKRINGKGNLFFCFYMGVPEEKDRRGGGEKG